MSVISSVIKLFTGKKTDVSVEGELSVADFSFSLHCRNRKGSKKKQDDEFEHAQNYSKTGILMLKLVTKNEKLI